jgi:hypothetical protein
MADEEPAPAAEKRRPRLVPRPAPTQEEVARAELAQTRADREALLRRMEGRPAAETLARLANGDPLRLYECCAHRIRETFFFLDPDRVFERVLPLAAVGLEVDAEASRRPEWLVGLADRAIQAVLDHDREQERAGIPLDAPEEFFPLFSAAFYIDAPLARLSSVRLNGLEERVRKGFYYLLVEGRPLEECYGLGLGPPDVLQRDMLGALEAIALIDEGGLRKKKRKS